MRRSTPLLAGLLAGFLHGALTAPASAGYPLDVLINMNISFTPASYSGCTEFDDDAVGTCENLESTWTHGAPNFAWVVLSRDGGLDGLVSPGGDAGIGGIDWGIAYDPTVDVQGWALCSGGSEIPQDDFGGTWPASDTGNATTWSGGCYLPSGEVAKVGFLTLGTSSVGFVGVVSDPRLDGFGKCDGLGAGASCAPDAVGFCVCVANFGFAVAGAESIPICGNACSGTPVRETSWGELKTLF